MLLEKKSINFLMTKNDKSRNFFYNFCKPRRLCSQHRSVQITEGYKPHYNDFKLKLTHLNKNGLKIVQKLSKLAKRSIEKEEDKTD